MQHHHARIAVRIALLVLGVLPATVYAAETVYDVLFTVQNIINTLVPIVLGLAVLGVFWGMVRFLFGGSDSEARKGGIKTMLLGILVLFVMVSLWGIIGLLQRTIGIEDAPSPLQQQVR